VRGRILIADIFMCRCVATRHDNSWKCPTKMGNGEAHSSKPSVPTVSSNSTPVVRVILPQFLMALLRESFRRHVKLGAHASVARVSLRFNVLALLSSCCGFAQDVTLNLTSGSGIPGTTVTLNITLNSSGVLPAVVQWTLNYSTVDFSSATVTAGTAAIAAGKQVSCNNTSGSATCVLWGINSNTISKGVAATVALTIPASTLNTSLNVQLVNTAAAALDSTALMTTATGGTVTIVHPTWAISGTINGGSGATVTLSGSASATVTADGSGNYSFTGLANGPYTVTPSKTGFTVSPASQPVTIISANVNGVNFSASANSSSTLAVNYSRLNFGWSGALITSPQTVTVNISPAAAVAWTATSNQPNITINPPSGVGSGALQISVSPGPRGTVTVTAAGATNSPQQIQVDVTNVAPGVPFGSFDTPVNNTSGITGAIPVTGWAFDNIEVSSVGIWREPVAGETPNANGLVYIGNATFVPGARPDVQAAFPTSPWSYRGGWGYMLLTNFLPNSVGPMGNGIFRLHAIVVNAAGTKVDLGARTLTVDNAHASKPFGTIDTPDQGGTVSGNAFVNFGWALTQSPYVIPMDGSTITVILDGVPVSHPNYNQYRSDIANLLPGLANSNGAVGFFYIDTTKLANGVHTISWNVFDNAGRGDGIGSRYFTVANTGSGNVPATDEPIEAAQFGPQDAAVYSVSIEELGRIELPVGATSGCLVVKDERRPLPAGSTLKGGRFYWQAGPGFLGRYDLLFERTDSTQVRVHVNIAPKSYPAHESR
jgi:hypothetical protein